VEIPIYRTTKKKVLSQRRKDAMFSKPFFSSFSFANLAALREIINCLLFFYQKKHKNHKRLTSKKGAVYIGK